MTTVTVDRPKDEYENVHWEMICLHNVLEMACNSILMHLENPPMDDLPNFLGYCQTWVSLLEVHHTSEDAVMFPFFKTHGNLDFSDQSEQHKEIHHRLEEFDGLLTGAREDTSKFDANAVKEALLRAKTVLVPHLDNEVAKIAPENLKAAGYKEADLKQMMKDHIKHGMEISKPFQILPFVPAHTSPEMKPVWPPFPWVLKKVLIPYFYSRRYSGYWKYAPYSVS